MRYLPHTEIEITEMLKSVGAKSVDALFGSVPEHLRFKGELNLPKPLSEQELLAHLNSLSSKNKTDAISFLGAGAYRHFTPSAVKALVSRSEFVTPYTPYQPEISQGTLQAIFEYQTMMCRLFGMDVSNASHYCGSTATAEAALLAVRNTKRKKLLVADTVHPEYRETIATILKPTGAEIILAPHDETGKISRSHFHSLCKDDCAGLIAGYPNFFGVIDDLQDLADAVHKAGGLFITTTPEPLSLGMIEAPGNLGADISVGEGQSFGCGLNFGGPYLGIFTAKEKFLRMMPGRIVGETKDTDGRRGFVLTFVTREQHIRRERATSNICSNQALCATTAAVYLSLFGKEGLAKLAELNYAKAEYAKRVVSGQWSVVRFSGPTFNEFVVDVSNVNVIAQSPLSFSGGSPEGTKQSRAENLLSELAKKNIFAGVALGRWYPQYKNCILVCVTETNSKEEIDLLIKCLSSKLT